MTDSQKPMVLVVGLLALGGALSIGPRSRAASSPQSPNTYPLPCNPRECTVYECGTRPDGCGGVNECGTCGICNNGACEAGESCFNCPSDCGVCPGAPPPSPPPSPGPTPPPAPPGGGGAPTANAGGPYSARVYEPILFDATLSSDPQGNATLTYLWDFGDLTVSPLPLTTHAYSAPNTYLVRLVVTDDAGHSREATTDATVAQDSSGPRFFTAQDLVFDAGAARLYAAGALSLGPEDGLLYEPQMSVRFTSPQGTVLDQAVHGGSFSHTVTAPRAGDWLLDIEYFYASRSDPAAPPIPVDRKQSVFSVVNDPPPPIPNGTAYIAGPRGLWWWGTGLGSPHRPAEITLTAQMAPGGQVATGCSWSLFPGPQAVQLEPTDCQVTVKAVSPSETPEDVGVVLQVEGATVAPPGPYWLTVHSVSKLEARDGFGGPEMTRPTQWPNTPGWRTDIPYSILSQFGEIVSGLYCEEQFGSVHNFQYNDWDAPSPLCGYVSGGTLNEVISISCMTYFCWDPPPVSNVYDPYAYLHIRQLPQSWFVGTNLLYSDLRIQTNTQLWRLGYGQHTSVTSPVPDPLP